jgi:hypothetical protein
MFGCLGALSKDAFAAKLPQTLVEKVTSKRRRADPSRDGLSIEQPPLLWVSTPFCKSKRIR